MKSIMFCICIMIFLLQGCAARPPARTEYVDLPPLQSGFCRVFVSAGKISGVKLWSVHQVGPVFINNKQIGSTAENEHFVVDILPGTYETYCTPSEPQKNFNEKRLFAFKAGEERYFSCDMMSTRLGGFGLVGTLASKYFTKSYLEERPMDNPNSKLVSYQKISSESKADNDEIPFQ